MAHVLLAVDDSDASTRAAAFVERFFGGGGFKVTAVNVARSPVDMVPPVPFGGVYDWSWPGPVYGEVEPVEDEDPVVRQDAVAEAVASRQAPPGAAIGVVHGAPADAIVRAADDIDADLIVVGSNHRGFLDRVVLGSVSDKVAHKADRPVLIVP